MNVGGEWYEDGRFSYCNGIFGRVYLCSVQATDTGTARTCRNCGNRGHLPWIQSLYGDSALDRIRVQVNRTYVTKQKKTDTTCPSFFLRPLKRPPADPFHPTNGGEVFDQFQHRQILSFSFDHKVHVLIEALQRLKESLHKSGIDQVSM